MIIYNLFFCVVVCCGVGGGGGVGAVIAPRNHGEPRQVSEPSSDCDSENPIEIPAPTDAANPTRNAFQLFWKAKAAANSGARVEIDPSIKPRSPGCTTCSRNNLRWDSSSVAFALAV